jgi:hypothetical protein
MESLGDALFGQLRRRPGARGGGAHGRTRAGLGGRLTTLGGACLAQSTISATRRRSSCVERVGEGRLRSRVQGCGLPS